MLYKIAIITLLIEIFIAIRYKGYLLAIMIPFLLIIPNSIKFSLGINLNIFNLSVLILCMAYVKEYCTTTPLIPNLKKIVTGYLIYVLIYSLVLEIPQYGVVMYIQNMVLFFFEYIAVFLFMNYYEIDDRQIKVFDILLCITIFCVMIYGFMCYILGVNPYMAYVSMVTMADVDMSNAFQNEIRGALNGRISGTFSHPLQYGQVCLLIFSYLSFQLKGRVWNAVYILLMLMLTISTVLTGSRSSIFPLLTAFLFLTLSMSKSKIAIISIAIIMIAISIFPSLPRNTQQTVKAMVMVWDEKASDKAGVNGSSIDGRSGQLTAAFNVVEDNVLFGKGKGYVKNYGSNHSELYGYESVFLSMIVDGGIVGLLIFLVFYWLLYVVLINECYDTNQRNRVRALIIPFFISISLTGISYSFFTFFAIFYMLTYFNIRNQNNQIFD